MLRGRRRPCNGFTLVELIVATAILVILIGLAVPLARVAIKREKERELRRALWEVRDAIDRKEDCFLLDVRSPVWGCRLIRRLLNSALQRRWFSGHSPNEACRFEIRLRVRPRRQVQRLVFET